MTETSAKLIELLENARHHVMTPNEKFEQRVSFVYGMQKLSAPGFTKDEIRQRLIDLHGFPSHPSDAASVS